MSTYPELYLELSGLGLEDEMEFRIITNLQHDR